VYKVPRKSDLVLLIAEDWRGTNSERSTLLSASNSSVGSHLHTNDRSSLKIVASSVLVDQKL